MHSTALPHAEKLHTRAAELATCEICRSRIPDQAAYHGYINHPLHYTLCERCALNYAPHIAPALAIAEARRIIAAHQRRIGGAK